MWYQVSSGLCASFSTQTLKDSLADRVTWINVALSAFYRFFFKNKQRIEHCCFPALGIPLCLWSGQWSNCLISPWVGWSFCQRGRFYNSMCCDRTTAGAFSSGLLKHQKTRKQSWKLLFWVQQHHLTSMRAQKGVIGDGTRLSKRVKFVEPLSRDVELEQTVLLHAGKGHNFLTLSHSLFTAFPSVGKGRENEAILLLLVFHTRF